MVTVLPKITADAARNRSTTQADRSGTCPANAADPICVGMSAVAMMSLMPDGDPRERAAGDAGGPPDGIRIEVGERVEAGLDRRRPREAALEIIADRQPSRVDCRTCVDDAELEGLHP